MAPKQLSRLGKILWPTENELAHNYSCRQGYGQQFQKNFIRQLLLKKANEYFNALNDDKPFISFVSFPDPHHPFTPPENTGICITLTILKSH